MSSERLDDLIVGAALDDLSDEDRRALVAAAERDPDVGRRLEALRETLDRLALYPAVETPPADLRGRILATVQGPAAPAPGRRRIDSRWALGWAGVATAAALAASILAGVFAGGQAGRDERLTRLLADNAQQRAALVSIYRERPHIMPLSADPSGDGAWARLMMDNDGGQGMLVVDGLHPPEPGRTYQLWLVRPSGVRVSGAVFDTDPRGRAVVVLDVAGSILEFSSAGVTDEPAGGSAGPTGQRMLFGALG